MIQYNKERTSNPTLVFNPCPRFGEPNYVVSFYDGDKSVENFDSCACDAEEFVSQAHAVLASVEKSNPKYRVQDIEVIFNCKDKNTLYEVEGEYGIYSSAEALLEYHPRMVKTSRYIKSL